MNVKSTRKYTTIALAIAALHAPAYAAEEKPKANVQQDRLNKLAGKALGRVIYRGATLIDGTAAAPRADMSIIVSDDRIEAIVPSAQLTDAQKAAARIVDVAGQYVLPGLIDSHVHYATNPDRPYAEAELKRNIYGGVTGVRDMAGDARELAGLSREALLNRIPSPDIFYASLVAGPSFFKDPRTVVAALGTQPGTVSWLYAVDDKTKLPLAVAQARGTGATGMKIYANLPGTLVRKLIAEANSQHFPVWTHMQVYPATPYDSLGATAVSHVCMIARHVRETGKSAYGHSGEPSYEGLTADDPGIKKYIAALAKSGTIMDATLSVYKTDGPHCHLDLAGDITRARTQTRPQEPAHPADRPRRRDRHRPVPRHRPNHPDGRAVRAAGLRRGRPDRLPDHAPAGRDGGRRAGRRFVQLLRRQILRPHGRLHRRAGTTGCCMSWSAWPSCRRSASTSSTGSRRCRPGCRRWASSSSSTPSACQRQGLRRDRVLVRRHQGRRHRRHDPVRRLPAVFRRRRSRSGRRQPVAHGGFFPNGVGAW
jgi:hypothetical protein